MRERLSNNSRYSEKKNQRPHLISIEAADGFDKSQVHLQINENGRERLDSARLSAGSRSTFHEFKSDDKLTKNYHPCDKEYFQKNEIIANNKDSDDNWIGYHTCETYEKSMSSFQVKSFRNVNLKGQISNKNVIGLNPDNNSFFADSTNVPINFRDYPLPKNSETFNRERTPDINTLYQNRQLDRPEDRHAFNSSKFRSQTPDLKLHNPANLDKKSNSQIWKDIDFNYQQKGADYRNFGSNSLFSEKKMTSEKNKQTKINGDITEEIVRSKDNITPKLITSTVTYYRDPNFNKTLETIEEKLTYNSKTKEYMHDPSSQGEKSCSIFINKNQMAGLKLTGDNIYSSGSAVNNQHAASEENRFTNSNNQIQTIFGSGNQFTSNSGDIEGVKKKYTEKEYQIRPVMSDQVDKNSEGSEGNQFFNPLIKFSEAQNYLELKMSNVQNGNESNQPQMCEYIRNENMRMPFQRKISNPCPVSSLHLNTQSPEANKNINSASRDFLNTSPLAKNKKKEHKSPYSYNQSRKINSFGSPGTLRVSPEKDLENNEIAISTERARSNEIKREKEKLAEERKCRWRQEKRSDQELDDLLKKDGVNVLNEQIHRSNRNSKNLNLESENLDTMAQEKIFVENDQNLGDKPSNEDMNSNKGDEIDIEFIEQKLAEFQINKVNLNEEKNHIIQEIKNQQQKSNLNQIRISDKDISLHISANLFRRLGSIDDELNQNDKMKNLYEKQQKEFGTTISEANNLEEAKDGMVKQGRTESEEIQIKQQTRKPFDVRKDSSLRKDRITSIESDLLFSKVDSSISLVTYHDKKDENFLMVVNPKKLVNPYNNFNYQKIMSDNSMVESQEASFNEERRSMTNCLAEKENKSTDSPTIFKNTQIEKNLSGKIQSSYIVNSDYNNSKFIIEQPDEESKDTIIQGKLDQLSSYRQKSSERNEAGQEAQAPQFQDYANFGRERELEAQMRQEIANNKKNGKSKNIEQILANSPIDDNVNQIGINQTPNSDMENKLMIGTDMDIMPLSIVKKQIKSQYPISEQSNKYDSNVRSYETEYFKKDSNINEKKDENLSYDDEEENGGDVMNIDEQNDKYSDNLNDNDDPLYQKLLFLETKHAEIQSQKSKLLKEHADSDEQSEYQQNVKYYQNELNREAASVESKMSEILENIKISQKSGIPISKIVGLMNPDQESLHQQTKNPSKRKLKKSSTKKIKSKKPKNRNSLIGTASQKEIKSMSMKDLLYKKKPANGKSTKNNVIAGSIKTILSRAKKGYHTNSIQKINSEKSLSNNLVFPPTFVPNSKETGPGLYHEADIHEEYQQNNYNSGPSANKRPPMVNNPNYTFGKSERETDKNSEAYTSKISYLGSSPKINNSLMPYSIKGSMKNNETIKNVSNSREDSFPMDCQPLQHSKEKIAREDDDEEPEIVRYNLKRQGTDDNFRKDKNIATSKGYNSDKYLAEVNIKKSRGKERKSKKVYASPEQQVNYNNSGITMVHEEVQEFETEFGPIHKLTKIAKEVPKSEQTIDFQRGDLKIDDRIMHSQKVVSKNHNLKIDSMKGREPTDPVESCQNNTGVGNLEIHRNRDEDDDDDDNLVKPLNPNEDENLYLAGSYDNNGTGDFGRNYPKPKRVDSMEEVQPTKLDNQYYNYDDDYYQQYVKYGNLSDYMTKQQKKREKEQIEKQKNQKNLNKPIKAKDLIDDIDIGEMAEGEEIKEQIEELAKRERPEKDLSKMPQGLDNHTGSPTNKYYEFNDVNKGKDLNYGDKHGINEDIDENQVSGEIALVGSEINKESAKSDDRDRNEDDPKQYVSDQDQSNQETSQNNFNRKDKVCKIQQSMGQDENIKEVSEKIKHDVLKVVNGEQLAHSDYQYDSSKMNDVAIGKAEEIEVYNINNPLTNSQYTNPSNPTNPTNPNHNNPNKDNKYVLKEQEDLIIREIEEEYEGSSNCVDSRKQFTSGERSKLGSGVNSVEATYQNLPSRKGRSEVSPDSNLVYIQESYKSHDSELNENIVLSERLKKAIKGNLENANKIRNQNGKVMQLDQVYQEHEASEENNNKSDEQIEFHEMSRKFPNSEQSEVILHQSIHEDPHGKEDSLNYTKKRKQNKQVIRYNDRADMGLNVPADVESLCKYSNDKYIEGVDLMELSKKTSQKSYNVVTKKNKKSIKSGGNRIHLEKGKKNASSQKKLHRKYHQQGIGNSSGDQYNLETLYYNNYNGVRRKKEDPLQVKLNINDSNIDQQRSRSFGRGQPQNCKRDMSKIRSTSKLSTSSIPKSKSRSCEKDQVYQSMGQYDMNPNFHEKHSDLERWSYNLNNKKKSAAEKSAKKKDYDERDQFFKDTYYRGKQLIELK